MSHRLLPLLLLAAAALLLLGGCTHSAHGTANSPREEASPEKNLTFRIDLPGRAAEPAAPAGNTAR